MKKWTDEELAEEREKRWQEAWRIPEERFVDAQSRACTLLYPGGSWGGYAGWFEPNISGRDASPLMNKIAKGLREDDTKALKEAIEMLRTEHTKFLSKARKGAEDVQCKPTERGEEVALLLEAVCNQLYGGAE